MQENSWYQCVVFILGKVSWYSTFEWILPVWIVIKYEAYTFIEEELLVKHYVTGIAALVEHIKKKIRTTTLILTYVWFWIRKELIMTFLETNMFIHHQQCQQLIDLHHHERSFYDFYTDIKTLDETSWLLGWILWS